MTAYEQQIQSTSLYYDEQMRAMEQEEIEILCSDVPDSRLNRIISNPFDEGIDEG